MSGPSQLALGFYGYGKIAKAMRHGFALSDLDRKCSFIIFKETQFGAQPAAPDQVVTSVTELCTRADLIFICKPKVTPELLTNIPGCHCFITVCAEHKGERMQESLQTSTSAWYKLMPNVNVAYNKGVLGLSRIHVPSSACTHIGPRLQATGLGGFPHDNGDKSASDMLVKYVIGRLGAVHSIPHDMMDAFTALAGCGPALAVEFTQTLARSAITSGLRHKALEIAIQMIQGTFDNVTFPVADDYGVTYLDSMMSRDSITALGVSSLRAGPFDRAVAGAVEACTQAGREASICLPAAPSTSTPKREP